MSNQNSYYNLTNCYFCGRKLQGSHIGFAKLTDYNCPSVRCKNKFSYYTCFDDAYQIYYEAGFTYKKCSFRFIFGKETNKTLVHHDSFADYVVFDKIIEIKDINELEEFINKLSNLTPFS